MTALLGQPSVAVDARRGRGRGFLTLALDGIVRRCATRCGSAASLKFLVPFVLLLALGAQFGWRSQHACDAFASRSGS